MKDRLLCHHVSQTYAIFCDNHASVNYSVAKLSIRHPLKAINIQSLNTSTRGHDRRRGTNQLNSLPLRQIAIRKTFSSSSRRPKTALLSFATGIQSGYLCLGYKLLRTAFIKDIPAATCATDNAILSNAITHSWYHKAAPIGGVRCSDASTCLRSITWLVTICYPSVLNAFGFHQLDYFSKRFTSTFAGPAKSPFQAIFRAC